jgi:hypothetical protein
MAVTLETLHKELKQMRNDLHFLKHVMEEEYELSDEAKQRLEIARKTPRSDYIDHEDVKKMLLE